MVQQVLHPAAGAAGERTMAQRLVLCALLTDDEHFDLLITETPAIEHRPEVPAELLVARHGDPEAAVVGCLREQPGPAAILGRARVVLPGRSTVFPVLLPHGWPPLFSTRAVHPAVVTRAS